MARLISFRHKWDLSTVSNRAVIAKLIPLHLVSDENVRCQAAPYGGLMIWCVFPLLTRPPLPAAERKPRCLAGMQAMTTTRHLLTRHADRWRDTENWYTMWIYNKNMKKLKRKDFDADEHGGRCAREDRWDALSTKSRSFSSFRAARIHRASFRWKPLNVGSVNSGTVVLLRPPAERPARRLRRKSKSLFAEPCLLSRDERDEIDHTPTSVRSV